MPKEPRATEKKANSAADNTDISLPRSFFDLDPHLSDERDAQKDLIDKLSFIINSTKDFVTIINRDYTYEIINDAYCQAFHVTPESVVGKRVSEIWGFEKFSSSIKENLDACFTGKEIKRTDKFKFGYDIRTMEVYYYPYYYNGRVTHVVVVSKDITKQKRLESKVRVMESL